MRRSPARSLSNGIHIPVMTAQVKQYLQGCPPGIFVDATLGGGGHTIAVQKSFKDVFSCVGFDLDAQALERTKQALKVEGVEAELVKSNFAQIADYLAMKKIDSVSAILYDLGISSQQIDNPATGFSYLKDGPLGLSFDNSRPYAAAELIEESSEQQLTGILRAYVQEPRARSLARAIKNSPTKIETTSQLASVIRKISGDRFFIKTASRIFQALRISVNDELGNIDKSISSVLLLLKPGGRAIVISYHSLEDGLIKQLFKKYSGRCICPGKVIQCQCGAQKLVKILTAKPVQPDVDEVASNPRARSAKMRVVERIAA
jgi:16S rRNA (cytosine1402-N4)-methyltransferase